MRAKTVRNEIFSRERRELRVIIIACVIVIALVIGIGVPHFKFLSLDQKQERNVSELEKNNENISSFLKKTQLGHKSSISAHFIQELESNKLITKPKAYFDRYLGIGEMERANSLDRNKFQIADLNGGREIRYFSAVMHDDTAGILNTSWVYLILAIALVFVSAFWIFQRYILGSMATPINKLSDAMQETFQAGGFFQGTKSDDMKFGRLVKLFNQMQQENIALTKQLEQAHNEIEVLKAQHTLQKNVVEVCLRGTNQYAVFTDLDTGERVGDVGFDGVIGDIFEANPQTIEELENYISNSFEGQVERIRVNTQNLPELVPSEDLVQFICEVKLKNSLSYIISRLFVPGEFYGLLISDVSNFKRKQEKQFQVQKMEAIGSLASGIAHDFNNILAIIQGVSHLGIKGKLDETQSRKGFEKILDACQRATSVIDQLMLYSTIKPDAKSAPINLNACLKNNSEIFHAILGPQIELSVKAADKYWILGNEDILVSAMINICKNAAKAITNGGKLDFVVKDAEQQLLADSMGEVEGEWLHLSISDNGIGIDSSTLSRIFDPFFTTYNENGGQGLGLMMVKNAVHNLGGTIYCESTPGEGTVFQIFLPMISPPKDINLDLNGNSMQITKGSTVCLVDDEILLLEVMEEYLGDIGYNVISIKSFTGALEYLAKNSDFNIDVLVSDERLKDGNGSDLVAIVKQAKPDIGCILISGQFEETDSNLADALLRKPFDLDKLVHCIESMLIKEVS